MAISLPSASGNTGVNDWSDVYNNDAQLVTEIDDRDGNYQTILSAAGLTSSDYGTGTYLVGSRQGATNGMVISGGNITVGATNPIAPPLIYFDDADYTIASKTQKLRLRAQVAANATAPAINFTFGLYPVTAAGGALVVAYTTGTVTSGSTVLFTTPSASTVAQANSGDFTIPSDGAYVLGVVVSGTATANSATVLHAQLQTRWV